MLRFAVPSTQGGNIVSVNAGQISLENISLEALPRLEKLRDSHFSTRPAVCVELPRLMTRYMRHNDNPSDSSEIRAAKRLKFVLENKRGLIQDGDLLAGPWMGLVCRSRDLYGK